MPGHHHWMDLEATCAPTIHQQPLHIHVSTGHQDAKAQSILPRTIEGDINKLVREQIVRLVSWFIKAQAPLGTDCSSVLSNAMHTESSDFREMMAWKRKSVS